MDAVERMYRHLVRTIRTHFPPYLTQPFEVGELTQTILPYRLHRRELGLDTNQDYEMTMLELLSGARGYLVVDDRMRDALQQELASPSANPGLVRDFASAHVALAPEAVHRLEMEGRVSGSQPLMPGVAGGVRTPATVPPLTGSSPVIRASTGVAAPPGGGGTEAGAARRPSRFVTVSAGGESCSFCKGELPPGRAIAFCPHCGQDLTVVHCPACGSELERGWKFCVTCGRAAEAS